MLKKALKFSLVLMVLALPLFFAVNFSLAQTDLGLEAGAEIGLTNTSPKTIIINVVRVLLGFLALIAVILIMYGGYTWMTAGGNAEKIEKAKKILRNAAIGLVIILSAFGIVTFLISVINPPPPPDIPCDPPCESGLCCFSGACGICDDCWTDGTCPPNIFRISDTVPYNGQENVYRNVVIRAFFNDEMAHNLNYASKFKVEKTADVAANGRVLAANYPPQIIAMSALAADEILGDVATSSAWREINFKAKATCKDVHENDVPNCLPGNSQFRVTINGNGGGIVTVDGRALSCAGGSTCVFTFKTGNLVDIEKPGAGIIPAQICRDDGSLKPDANIVGGWGKDDIEIAKLEFYQQKVNASGQPLENESQSLPSHPGDHTNYLYADHKYATAGMNIKDNYLLKAYTEDLAGHSATSTFIANIKPGHCCNGVKDSDEEDIDCGGSDCLACEGGACNKVEPNQCGAGATNCDDTLCSTGFCACTTDDCICKRRPIITGISPLGGFCKGDSNKFCRTNADCATVSGDKTCDTATPNGAPANLVTIQGRNFGKVSNLMENVLTNVNFETGAIGGVPIDWIKNTQNHASTGIVSEAGNYVSPSKSVKIHIDPSQIYPDVCSEDLCKRQGNYTKYPYSCNWKNEGGANKCVFPHHSYCGEGECKVSEGSALIWPYTNRVMWSELSYNISDLDFKVGDKYVLRFKYKGRVGAPINIQSAFMLGNTSQSWYRKTAAYSDLECIKKEWGGTYCESDPGMCKCKDDPSRCCQQAPYQTKPYKTFNFTRILPGEYNEWKTYESFFTYSAEMDSWKDRNNKTKRFVGLETNYQNTGPGTDLYIDDFMFARLPSAGGVTFKGDKANAGDDRMGYFPTDLNPKCISNWTDRQIIIVVPDGAPNGSIEVTAESGLADATDDVYGPAIKNFTANTIIRPGICRIENTKCQGGAACAVDHGIQNDTITYYGLNLAAGTEAYYGSWWGTNSKALGSIFGASANLEGAAKVPNIAPGQTTTFVVKNANSNNVDFFKDDEPYLGPLITSFDPKIGTSTQYVTIRGRGFGNAQDQSRVFFGEGGDKTEASYDFPAVCADSVWRDNQVIVKVPKAIPPALYSITMELQNNTAITSGDKKFEVRTAASLLPSVCKIHPEVGPVGSEVSLWGEYFGVKDAVNSKVKFNLNKMAAVNSWGTDESVKEGLKPDKIKTVVPAKSITGPVYVIKQISCQDSKDCTDGTACVNNLCRGLGNGVNYKVGECKEDIECGGEAVCCPADSQAKGRCKDHIKNESGVVIKNTVADLCYNEFKSCVNEWDFSTKPGGKGDPCDADANPQCQSGACQEGLVCDSSQLSETQPCGICREKCGEYPACDAESCDATIGEKCITTVQKDKTSSCLCKKEPTSCTGYDLQQCNDSKYCPNSPGNCSTYLGGNPYQISTCDYSCKSVSGCKGPKGEALCKYIPNLNKCFLRSDEECSLDTPSEIGIDGVKLTQTCILHELSGRWKIDYKSTCPPNWTKISGDRCIKDSETCNLCSGPSRCMKRGGVGKCGIDTLICPTGSVCGSDNKCVKDDSKKCECCCDINQNYPKISAKYPGNPACCAPLVCGNDCGSGGQDKTPEVTGYIDTNPYNEAGDVDYGLCSGCANIGSTQADHDRACNCTGTTGKYCDGSLPGGVCRDCTELTADTECTKHEASCCVDAKNYNACKGLPGNKNIIKDDTPNLAYCSYYDCGGFDIDFKCASTTPGIGSSTVPSLFPYETVNCDDKCEPPPERPCYDEETQACTVPCGATYRCLGINGCFDYNGPNPKPHVYPLNSASNPYSRCNRFEGKEETAESDEITIGCACCCDPDKNQKNKYLEDGKTRNTLYDTCQDLDNKKLECTADKGDNCTGKDRGLCCGCDADLDCVPQPPMIAGQPYATTTPSSVGCGFDACCYQRPSVISTVPKANAKAICRNPEISALFDSQMDITSFTGNIIVTYASTTCATGTVEMTKANLSQKNFWQRLAAGIKNFFYKILGKNSEKALARVPGDGKKFCVVPGSTGSRQETVSKKDVTRLVFNINNFLEPNTDYYVIVKGDPDLLNLASEGVLSKWKVGMNDKEAADRVFGSFTFTNAKVWTFKTKDEICPIDKASVFPPDYLFQTSANDLKENDVARDNTYDTADDGDKDYLAQAIAADGQVLVPVTGYRWVWDWNIINTSVVATTTRAINKTNINSAQQLVAARENITYGETKILATVRLIDFAQETRGNGKKGKTPVRVFLCKNPWPDKKLNGSWEPAKDWLRCVKTVGGKKTDYGSCSNELPANDTRGDDCDAFDGFNNPVVGAKCADNCTITDAGCLYTNQELFYCQDKGEDKTADDLPNVYGDVIRGSSTVQDVFKEFYYLRH